MAPGSGYAEAVAGSAANRCSAGHVQLDVATSHDLLQEAARRTGRVVEGAFP